MKITIDIEYPEQFGFANVEVLFPSGNKYSVNGYKVLSVKEKTAEILCFQHNHKIGTVKAEILCFQHDHKIGTVNKRIRLEDNGDVTFKLDKNRKFLLGKWKEE